MKTLRLGISPCPNDVFIFSGLLLDKVGANGLRFEVAFEDVETLNTRARAGEGDALKISYASAIHCAETYELLDCGGALGRGCGPLLLRCGAAAWDADAEILVPGQFTTANFLLDHWAGRPYRGACAPLRKRFLPFDALYEALRRTPGAQGVVIHEKRFTYERDDLTLVRDLGQDWEETTGFAIPLGAIVLRRALGLKTEMETLIRASLDWAESHRDEALVLCRRYAQDLDEAVIAAHVALYVNEYSRDLGNEGRAAVEFFLARQMQVIRV